MVGFGVGCPTPRSQAAEHSVTLEWADYSAIMCTIKKSVLMSIKDKCVNVGDMIRFSTPAERGYVLVSITHITAGESGLMAETIMASVAIEEWAMPDNDKYE